MTELYRSYQFLRSLLVVYFSDPLVIGSAFAQTIENGECPKPKLGSKLISSGQCLNLGVTYLMLTT